MAEQPNGLARIQRSSSKVPPTLTEGTITPEILHRWERACLDYFHHKKVAGDKQVEDIFFEIKDLRLSRWIEARGSALKVIPFANFMDELREEALEPNWAQTLRTEVLRTRQDNRVFFDWVCEVECKNAILAPVPSAHISDQQLRDHFEVQMDNALAQRCQKDSITSITDYQTWTNMVKQEDKLLQQDLENARSVGLVVLAADSRPHTNMASSACSASSNLAPSFTGPPPPSFPSPPIPPQTKITMASTYEDTPSKGKGHAKDTTVLILGGGVSGVIAARTLTQKGITNFKVVEAQAELGGRLHSETFGEGNRKLVVEVCI